MKHARVLLSTVSLAAIVSLSGCAGLFSPAQAPATRAEIDAVVATLDRALALTQSVCGQLPPSGGVMTPAQCQAAVTDATQSIAAARQVIAVWDTSQTVGWTCAIAKAADALQALGSVAQAVGQPIVAELVDGLAMADRILLSGSCQTTPVKAHSLAKFAR